MSIQHNGYILEKGKMQGKLDRRLVVFHSAQTEGSSTYTCSSRGFSGLYQLTLSTLSYSSKVCIGIGM